LKNRLTCLKGDYRVYNVSHGEIKKEIQGRSGRGGRAGAENYPDPEEDLSGSKDCAELG
jgi:hypothetical protein